MKCVAIDDEPIALTIIEEYCRRHGDIELLTFSSPSLGLENIKNNRPDVIFLDIEMGSHNGIDIAKELPKDICVIFTSAYSQYALEGFNVDAVDFLHKPIFYPRFLQAMQKVKRILCQAEDQLPAEDILSFKTGHQNILIKLSEIRYIEAMDNYIKIYRKNLPTVITQMTMKEIESRLPDDKFLRPHRSFIVALSEIEKYSNSQIFLRDLTQAIPIGRKYKDGCKAAIKLISKSET